MQQTLEAAVEFLLPFAIGVVLILLGRRLFWALGGLAFAGAALVISAAIFVPSALSFIATDRGVQIDVAEQQAPTVFLIAVLAGGAVGIVFTLLLRQVASAVVGFVFGVLFTFFALELFGFDLPEPVRRSLIIIIGTFVAIVALRQPEETMILLSALLGSQLILVSSRLSLSAPLSAYVWLICMLVGIVYQTSVWRTEQRRQIERQAAVSTAARN